jgi:hypothetical protein
MKIFLLLFLTAIGVGAETQLELISDFSTPRNLIYEKTLVGGLSGIFFKASTLFAVSDDRGQNNEPRVYSFKLLGNILTAGMNMNSTSKPNAPLSEADLNFKVSPASLIFLKDNSKQAKKRIQIDAEGLVPFESGWLVSSEGNYNSVPRRSPSLIYFDSSGQFIREIHWPEQFTPNPTGKQKKGLRSNYAFEGLSVSPDQKYLFAIHEAPLIQHNLSWKAGDPGEVHLLRFRIRAGAENIEIDKDISYKVDGYKKGEGKILASGVSEILALDTDKVLILERATSFGTLDFLRHDVKIYEISFAQPAEKRLVLDLSEIKKLLKTTKDLDNFEGMALGPIINNQPTLLMVSDDNFNPLEKTIWLLFKLVLEPK